jgi:hypothetical protein
MPPRFQDASRAAQAQSQWARCHALVKTVYGLAGCGGVFIVPWNKSAGFRDGICNTSGGGQLMRIAMWSGPRNLSTAMMYSFGARADFSVMDEPFYAPFLLATGNDHTMREEIIAVHETDPEAVARSCLAPTQTPHLYMKHMPQHMIDGFPMDWAGECVNVHLLRHPARVIASYAAKWPDVTFEQTGFAQQAALFDEIGGIVIDSHDIRENPEKALRRLCEAIDLPLDSAMLKWPAGPRPEDGLWARHWYGAVHGSTGFAGPEGPLPQLEGRLRHLLEQALPFYERMSAAALR